jgi:hypothetical protein
VPATLVAAKVAIGASEIHAGNAGNGVTRRTGSGYQEVDVVGGDDVAQNDQPEALLGLEQPVQPSLAVACEPQEYLPSLSSLMTQPPPLQRRVAPQDLSVARGRCAGARSCVAAPIGRRDRVWSLRRAYIWPTF